jgi:hypothetical protein
MNTEISGYLVYRVSKANSSCLLKVKDHADLGFLEILKRIADLLQSVSTKYSEGCIDEAWIIVILVP